MISRSRLFAAVVIALGLLGWSAWRSHAATAAQAELDSRIAATFLAANPAAPPADTSADKISPVGAALRVEVKLGLKSGTTGAPLVLRLRARDGAERPFDITVTEARPRPQFVWPLTLPVREPELPLRVELQGDGWCLASGSPATTIGRLDQPFKLSLVRAHRIERLFQAEGTLAPIAGVAIRQESGVLLATSDASGRASFLRPEREGVAADALFALASGFSPALIEEERGHAILLRSAARGGVVVGRAFDPTGAPAAGVRVVPRYRVGDMAPVDPAANALFLALHASRERSIVALAAISAADGRFEIPWPWPCAVRLRADHRALGTLGLELPHAAGESDAGRTTTVELRFPVLIDAAIVVTVGGAPAPGISVEAMTRDVNGERGVAAGLTDAAGRLALALPAIEPLWIVLKAARRAASVHDVKLDAANGGEVLSFAMRSGCDVVGRLPALVQPEIGVHVVQLRDGPSRLLLDEAVVERDGRFRLAQVPTGRPFVLELTQPGMAGSLLLERELDEPSGDASGAVVPAEVDLGDLELPAAGK
ncbi:MAG: hypothetical protein EXS13_09940 [Planctomycetes bacterium]|nr:hypothetical protein [Planctomycetota bacterium]